MAEERKRLIPTPDTLRELFLKSGNQCAFPGCSNLMMNADGVFIGQTCHIEAAERGGERFNAKQSNEDCRTFGNLMLMCYEHHQVTNDVVQYPVLKLKEMKRDHESKFVDVTSKMQAQFVDQSALHVPSHVQTLARMNRVLDWHQSDEELEPAIEDFKQLATRLQKVPASARQILSISLNRSKRGLSGYEVLVAEMTAACHIDDEQLQDQVAILKSHGFAEFDYNADDRPVVSMHDPADWELWPALKSFCQLENTPLSAIIEDLKFDMLDDVGSEQSV